MTNAARCLDRYYTLVRARLCVRCKASLSRRDGTECAVCAQIRADRQRAKRSKK
jgi:hypothetical protein